MRVCVFGFLNKAKERETQAIFAPPARWNLWLTCGRRKNASLFPPSGSDLYTQREPDRAPFASHAIS